MIASNSLCGHFKELTNLQSEIIITDQIKTEEALRNNENLEREDRRSAMREIHQNTKTELGEILNEEQLNKLRELRKAKQAEHRALRESVDRKALRQELKAYREANIQPVMETQRAKLEAELSQADKASLTEYRATLAEAKEQARTERQQMREQRQCPHHTRHQKRDLREQHPEIFGALEEMVSSYDADITRLLEEVADQAEQWDADKKAIMERPKRH